MKYKPLTRAQNKLLDTAAIIYDEGATKRDAAFIARELVQATLPHKNPGDVPLWKRTNGNLTLAIQPGMNLKTSKSYGYPYGTVPRLVLFWMTTEALRNKAKENPRHLHLGKSLKEFMLEIGLNPDNGSRGAKRSDAQLKELADTAAKAAPAPQAAPPPATPPKPQKSRSSWKGGESSGDVYTPKAHSKGPKRLYLLHLERGGDKSF